MLTMQDIFLKLAYSAVFFKLCIITAYLHYLFNSADFDKIESVSKLNASTLNRIIDLRGIHKDKKILALERTDLVELVSSTGATYQSELKILDANLTKRRSSSKPRVFSSAGELLESVEDSRGNVWIIQIVQSTTQNQNAAKFECGKSGAFLRNDTWLDLANHLSTFDIQTGTFNCKRDRYFCRSRGWDGPQLVLGLIKHDSGRNPREFVEMYQYNNCKLTSYESIFSWIELVLRKRLVHAKRADDEEDDDYETRQEPRDKEERSSLVLDLYYMNRWNEKANNLPQQSVPLFYSTLSVKYSSRARFHLVDGTHMPECAAASKSASTTPIYLMIDNKICYNYGANLNELPNYAHLDLFLLFLYPDMNVVFMVSFVLLNAHLIMIFFEYNESLLKQLLIGFIYLCIFNFILFSIWTLATNVSSTAELVPVSRLVTNACKQLLIWIRYSFMRHEMTQTIFAHMRYVTFYHVYIQPLIGTFLYVILSIVFYFHTKRNYYNHANPVEKISANDDENGKSSSSLIDRIARKFSNTNQTNNQTKRRCQRSNDSSFSSSGSKCEPSASKPTHIDASPASSRGSLLNRQSIFSQDDDDAIDPDSSSALVVHNRNASASAANRDGDSTRDTELQSDQSVPSLSPVRDSQQAASFSDEHDQSSPTPFYDIDAEISVSELIDQINGLTTIWLESSTHADRILSSLPSIEYCKCFYINTVKIHNYDETDTEREGTTTEEDDEPLLEAVKKPSMSESCACGRNSDLNKYLDENNIKLSDRIRRECSICLDKYKFGSHIKILPCGHAFHQRCIYEWFMSSVNYKCPVCRTCFYKFKKTL